MKHVARVGFAVLSLLVLGGGVWYLASPSRILDRARLEELTGAGRFGAAEELLEEYLRDRPEDGRAHLMLGRLLVERPDQPKEAREADGWSRRALEHLERVDLAGLKPEEGALVELARGKALFALRSYDEAEAAFGRALELDPRVPEAGWALLDLLYLEERFQETHDLALRLHEIEPDGRDRVQFLLELIREDVQPPDPGSLVELFEGITREHPNEIQPRIRLGLALIRNSRGEEGLNRLRALVNERPADPLAWEALLTGLDLASPPELFLQVFDQVPRELVAGPSFAKHRGRAAQERGDWAAAIEAYEDAHAWEPISTNVIYRLGRALRFAGNVAEGERVLERFSRSKQAVSELPALYREASEDPALGYRPDVELYARLADARRRALRPREARAWYELVLQARPGDPVAMSAIRELDSGADAIVRAR